MRGSRAGSYSRHQESPIMRAVVMDLKEKIRSKKRQEEEAFKWTKLGCNKQFEFNCKSRDMLFDELLGPFWVLLMNTTY